MPYQVIIETRAKKSYLDFPEKIQDQIDVAIDDRQRVVIVFKMGHRSTVYR